MIIWECNDGFVAEIQNDDDFDAFLKAFTANDDVKYDCHEDCDDCYDYDDDYDYDDCDYEMGYNPYMGCFDDDC